ncbi:KIFC1-like kinesin [Cladochytrium replicatum]|nr:KIFC1-like kinesin [Cladochytrium replicatum]
MMDQPASVSSPSKLKQPSKSKPVNVKIPPSIGAGLLDRPPHISGVRFGSQPTIPDIPPAADAPATNTSTVIQREETEFVVHSTRDRLKRRAEEPANEEQRRNVRQRPDPERNTNVPAPETKTAPVTNTRASTRTRGTSSRLTAPTISSRSKASGSGPTKASVPPKVASTAAVPKVSAPDHAAEPGKKRRDKWDVKGRLEDLEHEHSSTRNDLNDSRRVISMLEEKLAESKNHIAEVLSFRTALENKVVVKEEETSNMTRELERLRDEIHQIRSKHDDEIERITRAHRIAAEEARYSIETLTTEKKSALDTINSARAEIEQLKGVISTQSTIALAMEMDNRALRLKIETLEQMGCQQTSAIESLTSQLSGAKSSVANLESKVREEETIRRKLHNTIQELKGNIRVFCRVRPLLSAEMADNKSMEEVISHLNFTDGEDGSLELTQITENASGAKNSKTYPFAFDKVFQPKTLQAEVFEEISQLVQSALDGFNVCIFAYGQTGSGKTYTMEGGEDLNDPKAVGMIPRAVEQIFEAAEALKAKGWQYTMEAQYLEIYNESIRDLLDNNDNGTKKHEIKHHPTTNRTTVTDSVTVVVSTPKNVRDLLKRASHNRAVAATLCNERSSRSHSVFTLRLCGQNSVTDETCEGLLNLIDLAGSERLSSSGSTGDRLKETQAINKSLSCLGDVISALSNKDSHVPYRNSKLTYLLQNSLGGNCKTLMFVNVSPLPVNFNETLNSLRFATKVNSCQIGTARAKKG